MPVCDPHDDNSDTMSRARLIELGLRYVPKVARRYRGIGIDREELIAAGNLGLVEAALRFDESRGVKFVTYADWWIRKSILASIEALIGPVRLPRYWQDQLGWLSRARADWRARFGSSPTTEQLASSSGMTVEQVQRLERHRPRGVSLDQPRHVGDGRTLGDTLHDPRNDCPRESLIRQELADRLRGHLQGLDARQKRPSPRNARWRSIRPGLPAAHLA